jgi:hypothetical protein
VSFDPHVDLAVSAVAVAPSPALSGTTFTVTAGQGARFPNPGTQGYDLVAWALGTMPDPTNAEILRVTGLTGDVFTVAARPYAVTNNGNRAILVGDLVALRLPPTCCKTSKRRCLGRQGLRVRPAIPALRAPVAAPDRLVHRGPRHN